MNGLGIYLVGRMTILEKHSDESLNYSFESETEGKGNEKPPKKSVRDTMALIAFIISITGLITGLMVGPIGIGISAIGLIFSIFVRGGRKHFARYGLIFGMVGIFTGIIASIVQLILTVTPVVLPIVKAIGIIAPMFTYISSFFGWGQ